VDSAQPFSFRAAVLGIILEAMLVLFGLIVFVCYRWPYQPSDSTVHLAPQSKGGSLAREVGDA